MKVFIWIVIILGVIGGGYALYYHHLEPKKSLLEQANESPQEEEEDVAAAPTGKKMSFDSYMATNPAPQQCSVTDYLSDFDSRGTVYFASGKMRADLSTVAEGRTLVTSVIVKDDFTYLWMPPSTTGFKMKVTKEAFLPGGGTSGSNYTWSPARVGDYDCQPWTMEAAKFNLPAGVTFRELAEAGN